MQNINKNIKDKRFNRFAISISQFRNHKKNNGKLKTVTNNKCVNLMGNLGLFLIFFVCFVILHYFTHNKKMANKCLVLKLISTIVFCSSLCAFSSEFLKLKTHAETSNWESKLKHW